MKCKLCLRVRNGVMDNGPYQNLEMSESEFEMTRKCLEPTNIDLRRKDDMYYEDRKKVLEKQASDSDNSMAEKVKAAKKNNEAVANAVKARADAKAATKEKLRAESKKNGNKKKPANKKATTKKKATKKKSKK